MIKRISLPLFVGVSLGELFSHLMDWPLVHTLCKPAIMIMLLAHYVSAQRQDNRTLSVVLLLAVIFSWGGDVWLMGSGELFFMLGLVSFLIAHVFYIFTFRQFCSEDDSDALRGLHKIRFAFPIILYGSGLVIILYNHLDDLKIPVLVYALVLTLMVLNALFRFKRTTESSFIMVFGGAILFMISDSLLAVNKFLQPLPLAGFWIMVTYISAQFLMVKGIMKHKSTTVSH